MVGLDCVVKFENPLFTKTISFYFPTGLATTGAVSCYDSGCLIVFSNAPVGIVLVWVLAHCSIPGNEMEDSLAKRGAAEGTVYHRQIAYCEYFVMQSQWSNRNLGIWLHSIIPREWFIGMDLNRGVICMMSRLMSNHNRLDAHLFRKLRVMLA